MNFSVDNIKKNMKWLAYLTVCLLQFIWMALPAFSADTYYYSKSFSTYSMLGGGGASFSGILFAAYTFFAILTLICTISYFLLISYKLAIEFFGESLKNATGKELTMKWGGFNVELTTKIVGIVFVSLNGALLLTDLATTTLFSSFLYSYSTGIGVWLMVIFSVGAFLTFDVILKNSPMFSETAAPQKKYKCSQCGAPAARGAAFCQKCGGKVVEYIPEPAPVIVYMCEKCGNRSRKGIAFCSICGGKIIERAYRPQPKPQAPAPAPVAPQAPVAPAPQPQYQAAPQAPAPQPQYQAAPQAPAAPQPQAQPQAVCANCGAPALPGARFCNLCGGQIVMR